MNITNSIGFLSGFSTGHVLDVFGRNIAAIEQGGTQIIAAPLQAQSVTVTVDIALQALSKCIPISAPVQFLGGLTISLAAYPIPYFAAAIKDGTYEKGAAFINESIIPHLNRAWNEKIDKFKFRLFSFPFSKFPSRLNPDLTTSPIPLLPASLSPRMKKIGLFTANHFTAMSRVVVAISVVVMSVMGNNYAVLGGHIGFLAYRELKARCWMPKRIIRFVEDYMPILQTAAAITSGSLLGRFISVITLLSYIPSAKKRIHATIDRLFINRVKGESYRGPSIAQINETQQGIQYPSFEQMKAILGDGRTSPSLHDFELNPSYCSAPLNIGKELPEDKKLEDLLTLFNTVDWTKRYSLVTTKLADDDKFRAAVRSHYTDKFALNTELPEILLEAYSKQTGLPRAGRASVVAWAEEQINSKKPCAQLLEAYFIEKAQAVPQWKDRPLVTEQDKKALAADYAALWVKELMTSFVTTFTDKKVADLKLMGKDRMEGKQSELDQAATSLYAVLPYIKELQTTDKVAFEDSLLALAVEGGAYCPLGKKRAADSRYNEIMIARALKMTEGANDKEANADQFALRFQIDTLRERQYTYQSLWAHILKDIPIIQGDIHLFDFYRLACSKGFVPVTKRDDWEFGLVHLILWETVRPARREMYGAVIESLLPLVRTKTNLELTYFINKVIESHPGLTEQQRTELKDIAEDFTANKRVQRQRAELFALCAMGALKYTPAAKQDPQSSITFKWSTPDFY